MHVASQCGKKRGPQADEFRFSQSRMGLRAIHVSAFAALMKFLTDLLSVAVSAHCPIKSDILPVSHLSLHGVMSIVVVESV